MKKRGLTYYLFLLTILLLIGPHVVSGASDDAPMVGCTMPNFGCNDPTGPSETPVSTCVLISATLNEQELDVGDPTLTVTPGESITGTVTVETYNAGSSYDTALLAATPSYGDHETGYWEISSNIPADTATFEVEVDLTAPNDGGTYYVYFAWYWEKTLGNVMSLTNWQHPEGDVWDDGVDVADWVDFQAQQGIDNGWVETQYMNKDGEYDENVVFPGTAIRIEVQG